MMPPQRDSAILCKLMSAFNTPPFELIQTSTKCSWTCTLKGEIDLWPHVNWHILFLSSRMRPSSAPGMTFVFSVCRLVSRRCHTISALHQLRRSPSQVGSRTGARTLGGGFPAGLFRLLGGFTVPPSSRFQLPPRQTQRADVGIEMQRAQR